MAGLVRKHNCSTNVSSGVYCRHVHFLLGQKAYTVEVIGTYCQTKLPYHNLSTLFDSFRSCTSCHQNNLLA